MKEFKVGDKVALIMTVCKIDEGFSSSIKMNREGGQDWSQSCTEDGRVWSKEPITVFHLEDIQKSEYPKWMMVTNSSIYINSLDRKCWVKRYVIAKHNNKYIVISYADTEAHLKISGCETSCYYHAKDIEEVVEEMTMEQVNKALGKKIKIVE